jgi:hypothetical protein
MAVLLQTTQTVLAAGLPVTSVGLNGNVTTNVGDVFQIGSGEKAQFLRCNQAGNDNLLRCDPWTPDLTYPANTAIYNSFGGGTLFEDFPDLNVPGNAKVTGTTELVGDVVMDGTLHLPGGQVIVPAVIAPLSVYATIYSSFDAGLPVDQLLIADAYRTFIYFDSHNANSWKPSTNAHYTVPVGKKLIVVQTDASGITKIDKDNRQMRFRNTTDNVDACGPTQFQSAPTITNAADGIGFQWGPDLGPPGVPVIPAGKTVRLEIWNADNNQRAIGGFVMCREVPA